MMMRTLSLAALAATLAGRAVAHDGHAAAREMGPLHWLGTPDHAIVVVFAAGAALALVAALRRARRG